MRFPFDPSLRHHLFIAVGLFLWVFVFLFFTEPLDIKELYFDEKLLYLPVYSLVASFGYLLLLPLQSWLYAYNARVWKLSSELLMLFAFSLLGLVMVGCPTFCPTLAGKPVIFRQSRIRSTNSPTSTSILKPMRLAWVDTCRGDGLHLCNNDETRRQHAGHSLL